MFQRLYEFLILHGKIALPEIGVIYLENSTAVSDTANKTMINPVVQFKFQEKKETTERNLFLWLARSYGISDTEAIVRLTDFSFAFKNKLAQGEEVKWKGVGVFKNGLGGAIDFEPELRELAFVKPVMAEKVIREKASHMVRVGDAERSSEEMEEFYSSKGLKKSVLWQYVLAAVVIALIFMVFHFSQYGFDVSASANRQKVTAQELPVMLK